MSAGISSWHSFHVVWPATRKHSSEQGPVHPLDEAVGSGRSHLSGAVLDVFDREAQLEGMLLRPAAELPAVVGQDRAHGHAERLVEEQDPIVEQVTGGDRHLRVVDLAESERAEGIDHDLDVDLGDPLPGAPVEGSVAG